MELQLTIIALECFHFDHSCLLQIVQSEFFALHVWHSLHDLGDGVYNINEVVTLCEHYVYECTGIAELALETGFKDVVHQIGVGLIADLENVVFINQTKTCSCCL